jgi:hypothetical protein
MMRTTLDLDDAILKAARAHARRLRKSIGAVISDWAAQGLAAQVRGEPRAAGRRRLPTFPVAPDAPPLDLAKLQEILDDEGVLG